MPNILDTLDRPLLEAASSASGLVYAATGTSPARQRIYLEFALAAVEIVAAASLGFAAFAYNTTIWGMFAAVVLVGSSRNVVAGLKELGRQPAHYDAAGYRKALTDAMSNRNAMQLMLRLWTTMFPTIVFVDIVFIGSFPPSARWPEFGALVYFVLYCAKFHLRACEPPKPDDGDLFARPVHR